MISIKRLEGEVGCEVTGVDVRVLAETDFLAIYRSWLAHNVLVVRDQDLNVEEFLSYSRRFGSVVRHPSSTTRHPEYPEVTLLGTNKFDADGRLSETIYRRGAAGWHCDGSYYQEPFKATQLYAIALPSIGGDTLFASMYDAYDALPERLKHRLAGVRAVCIYGGREGLGMDLLDQNEKVGWSPVFHEIIRTHPETRRKALYFDPGKILAIEGVDEQESKALIDELEGYMVRPECVYRHKWRLGDVVIWDNRCSFHMAAGDYPPDEDRIHWRVSIKEHARA